MNSSLVSVVDVNKFSPLVANLALEGAFTRIESGAGFSANHVGGYSDSSGEEGGWDDGKYSDCPAG